MVVNIFLFFSDELIAQVASHLEPCDIMRMSFSCKAAIISLQVSCRFMCIWCCTQFILLFLFALNFVQRDEIWRPICEKLSYGQQAATRTRGKRPWLDVFVSFLCVECRKPVAYSYTEKSWDKM
jgi:hypothetical protein